MSHTRRDSCSICGGECRAKTYDADVVEIEHVVAALLERLNSDVGLRDLRQERHPRRSGHAIGELLPRFLVLRDDPRAVAPCPNSRSDDEEHVIGSDVGLEPPALIQHLFATDHAGEAVLERLLALGHHEDVRFRVTRLKQDEETFY
jgi:hypothetical protein